MCLMGPMGEASPATAGCRTSVQNVLEAGKVMKTICSKGVQNVQVHRVHNGPYTQTCCPGRVSRMCWKREKLWKQYARRVSRMYRSIESIMIHIHKHVVQDGCPKCVQRVSRICWKREKLWKQYARRVSRMYRCIESIMIQIRKHVIQDQCPKCVQRVSRICWKREKLWKQYARRVSRMYRS